MMPIMKPFIASLIVTIIGGVVLKIIEVNFFADTSPKPPQTEKLISQKKVQTPDKVIKNNRSSIESEIDNQEREILELMQIADKAYGVDSRNSEFLKVVKYSLHAGKFNLAINAADKIYGVTAKNDAFDLIIDRALLKGNYDVANSAASYIYGVTRKNEALKKILDSRISLNSIKK